MKNKILIGIIIFSLVFIVSCAQKPVACPADAKLCPDGSAVGRVAPNCEFAPCPQSNNSGCNYNNPDKTYIKQEKNCVINFLCVRGTRGFSDECGCGCEKINETIPIDTGNKTYCPPGERPQACTLEYAPVCGWFNESIKCIKEPCAGTYGNKCQACANPSVEYWTEGECPK